MFRPAHSSQFRVLLQGEGLDADEEYLGFYATRDVRAADPVEAQVLATALIERTWQSQAGSALTTVGSVQALSVRDLKWTPMRRKPQGFTFFTDDEAAQDAALNIERRAYGR
ncbi:hypothetical protein ACO2Q1_08005 [Brevundimonas sp. VNH65]|uniref:hypothetical protein n=1 Tax=Brevundimonas sp. VNH65 TaxID=3400917 RepID=UPI003BFFF5B8